MRCQGDHQLALQQRLAYQAEIEVLQIAQATVHELAGAAGGARGVVGTLDQRDAVAARGGVECDPGAGDPATDDHEIELVRAQSVNCASREITLPVFQRTRRGR